MARPTLYRPAYQFAATDARTHERAELFMREQSLSILGSLLCCEFSTCKTALVGQSRSVKDHVLLRKGARGIRSRNFLKMRSSMQTEVLEGNLPSMSRHPDWEHSRRHWE